MNSSEINKTCLFTQLLSLFRNPRWTFQCPQLYTYNICIINNHWQKNNEGHSLTKICIWVLGHSLVGEEKQRTKPKVIGNNKHFLTSFRKNYLGVLVPL